MRPLLATIRFNWECNLDCPMCEVWKRSPVKEMDTIEWLKIFSKLPWIPFIKITGGEPFLREDLSELVNGLLDFVRPRIIHITTNGTFEDRIFSLLNNCRNPEKIHLKLSLDDLDDIRGGKSIEEETLFLKRLLKLKKRLGFYLGLNFTFIPGGIDKLKRVVGYSKGLNIPIHITPAVYQGELLSGKKEIKFRELLKKESFKFLKPYRFKKNEIRQLLLISKSISKGNNIFERYLNSFIIVSFAKLLLFRKFPKIKCKALSNRIIVNPDGEMPLCSYISESAGNLKENSFKEIWENKKSKILRKVASKCNGCIEACELSPNVLFSGYIFIKMMKNWLKYEK